MASFTQGPARMMRPGRGTPARPTRCSVVGPATLQPVQHSLNGSNGNGSRPANPAIRSSDNEQEVAQLKAQLAQLQDVVQQLLHERSTHYPYRHTHDVKRKLTEEDWECLPKRIVLIRHGESQGNVEKNVYCRLPDNAVPLTQKGRKHARKLGLQLKDMLTELDGPQFRVFVMTSPYARTLETTDNLLDALHDQNVVGIRQAVQLREQDFGNFQDPTRQDLDFTERQRFGRFYYRFPNGESGADVYDRLTIFEDHLTRDMLMGRFSNSSLILVTHGLTMRIFLMRWFHWSVDEFLQVHNVDNCEPIVLEKLSWEDVQELQGKKYAHAKHCYHITPHSLDRLRGCAPTMASYFSRKLSVPSKVSWQAQRELMVERSLYGVAQYQDTHVQETPVPLSSVSFDEGEVAPALDSSMCTLQSDGEWDGVPVLSRASAEPADMCKN